MALDDIRVLDLTVARAGPTCVRQLADWGADVIRVEAPAEAGVSASAGGARHGSDFQNLHRNKRSLTLDLKSEHDYQVFTRLVGWADVVVENMRPEVKYRLRVDYDTVRSLKPSIVYGSISGFGQTGPYGDRGGVDQIAQGLGGLMSVTGLPGQGPLRVGVPISDLAAGMYLAIGILAALHERDRSGEGQWVQTSLLEAMIAMLDFQAARWTIDGEVPPQEGNHHPTGVPMGCFRTSDGYVNIAGSGGRLWERFCRTIERPELLEDPRFAGPAQRSANREELRAIIQDRLSERATTFWVEALNSVGVPAGPVNNIKETFEDPQVRHLEMVEQVPHPVLGELGLIRNAVSATRTPPRLRRASPELGQHNEEILAELGLEEAEAGVTSRPDAR
ncbi:MAG: CoA transferase [Acidimicrobiales bacterium]|nr:CoA transferase [Acidimicrobiales bacterium]